MLPASAFMGHLARLGRLRSFSTALLTCLAGSYTIFACGLLGLALYLPPGDLLERGWLPFVPGDLIKSSLAAFIGSRRWFEPL